MLCVISIIHNNQIKRNRFIWVQRSVSTQKSGLLKMNAFIETSFKNNSSIFNIFVESICVDEVIFVCFCFSQCTINLQRTSNKGDKIDIFLSETKWRRCPSKTYPRKAHYTLSHQQHFDFFINNCILVDFSSNLLRFMF